MDGLFLGQDAQTCDIYTIMSGVLMAFRNAGDSETSEDESPNVRSIVPNIDQSRLVFPSLGDSLPVEAT